MLRATESHPFFDCKVEVGFIKAEESSFNICKTIFSVRRVDLRPEEMRLNVQESGFNRKTAEIRHKKMNFSVQNESVNVQMIESAVLNRMNRRWSISIHR